LLSSARAIEAAACPRGVACGRLLGGRAWGKEGGERVQRRRYTSVAFTRRRHKVVVAREIRGDERR